MTHNTDDRDSVYREPRRDIVDFAFDETVANVFPDMIRRSVPGYDTVLPLTGLIAARGLTAGSRCYDLGCSLGAATLAVLNAIGGLDCKIIAVDNSRAMLDRALASRHWDARVEFRLADLRTIDIENAGAVILNYALQFIPVEDRGATLARIRRGMTPGGRLILSEKIAGNDEFDALHVAFKQANGYSELEISQKRAALDNVLVPEKLETHQARLREAGFDEIAVWFRCLNWVSLVARA